jgi:hypothetical protein
MVRPIPTDSKPANGTEIKYMVTYGIREASIFVFSGVSGVFTSMYAKLNAVYTKLVKIAAYLAVSKKAWQKIINPNRLSPYSQKLANTSHGSENFRSVDCRIIMLIRLIIEFVMI